MAINENVPSSTRCCFVSDLHGQLNKYHKLFETIKQDPPGFVLLGGDLLPSPFMSGQALDFPYQDFVNDFLIAQFEKLQSILTEKYPHIFLILGNDDGRFEEKTILEAETQGIWKYIHGRKINVGHYSFYGYSFVPPTPFLLKDWERYDVSRYVDPGCLSPEEGKVTIPMSDRERRYSTIASDLETLAGENDLSQAIFLFHAPPYNTKLDRAALDNQMIDHVPIDVHVGSIAIKRFIEKKQPLVTLHGHIHESPQITGSWREKLGKTNLFTAAHNGPELVLINFDLKDPSEATRHLL